MNATPAAPTVARAFARTVADRPDAVALRARAGEGWSEWTWADYAARATAIAGALGDLGVGRGDRVVLMLRNRPEFHAADMAVLLTGATPISIYNSSSPEQIAYLVEHSEARVGIVDDAEYLDRVLAARPGLPDLEHLAVVDDPEGRAPDDVHRFDDLCGADPVDLDSAAGIARPDDLVTVIYTSGTTGPPRGVMLDHANVSWTIDSFRGALDADNTGWRAVSFLPMAHIAERMVSHYMGIEAAYEVTTCPDPGAVISYFVEAHPDLVFAVPRVWEKAYTALHGALFADPAKTASVEQALDVGWQVSEHRARGEDVPAPLAAAWEQADQIFAGVRARVGLDEARVCITGAAPIPTQVLRFFRSIGVPLSEIYGLSETSGPMTWTPHRVKVGTVGPAIPGVEVRLADDGEVQCRGGNVFRGYLDDPEKTAAVLDDEGWFSSGDIGVLDDDGYLTIVDRKKELIITAGGKNISPANLEAAIKSTPLVGQACVVGDGRKYVAALVVLDPEAAPAWAQRHGIEATSLAELAEHPDVVHQVEADVDEVNRSFTHVEQVKRVKILHEEWQPDSEELTPTMKLKRRGIHTKYADEIESLYA